MARFFRTIILAASAVALAGCAHRTPVLVTVYDTTSGEPIEGVQVGFGYGQFLAIGPSGSEHITGPDGQFVARVASAHMVTGNALRPGYEYVTFNVTHFSEEEDREYLDRFCEMTLDPVEGESGWSLRVPMDRRETGYGLLITVPKGFRGPLVISRTAEPIAEHATDERLRSIDRSLDATREIVVPSGRDYFKMFRYDSGGYIESVNATRRGTVVHNLETIVVRERELWFVGNMTELEAFKRKHPYFTMKNSRTREATNAYNALVDEIIRQPI